MVYDFSGVNSPKANSSRKPVLSGLSPGEIAELIKDNFTGEEAPAFRIRQIHRWICSGVSSFDEMKNLPVDLRKKLDEKFRACSSDVTAKLEDPDGTVKLQIGLEDGNRVEAVILRDGKDRKTACLSVQSGCPAGCVFCRTAGLGFKRNLSAAEIAEEFLLLKRAVRNSKNTGVKENSSSGGENRNGITHIVFMGMGEPLLNLENLRKSVNFFCAEDGINISHRRITLSTCGIISGLVEFTSGGPDIRLAVSITSARENLRKRLMPVTLANPLKDLKEALLDYQKKRRRRVTLEAVLLSGINTGQEDAEAMARFAEGLDAVINLIPWNPVENPYPAAAAGNSGPLIFEGVPLKTPSRKETGEFAAALERKGLKVTKRFEKGGSVSGACGQLGS